MSFEIEGIIHKIFDTEQKTETFQTREFVITTEDTYPQYVKFQMTQDRCGMVDGYKESEKVKVFFDLRGREWNGKYFTNLNAWRIQKVEDATTGPQSPGAETPPVADPFDFPSEEPQSNTDNDLDDLPF